MFPVRQTAEVRAAIKTVVATESPFTLISWSRSHRNNTLKRGRWVLRLRIPSVCVALLTVSWCGRRLDRGDLISFNIDHGSLADQVDGYDDP